MDATGRDFGVVSFGQDGLVVAGWWLTEIAGLPAPSWSLSSEGAAADLLPALTTRLRQSATGLRLMVVGPEQDVLAVQSCALEAGLIHAELTLFATSTKARSLYCAHCKTTSSVQAAVGSVAPCAGCGRGLMVYSHLSTRSGSYLGFLADEEEPV